MTRMVELIIDKHIVQCEQTKRLARRLEEDRYSRLRSINKTADAPMHAKVRWCYLERCWIRPLHRAAKLNSPKRYIGSYELQNDSQRATALALISTLDRSAVDRNEQNAKKKRTERTKKNTAMMKDEFSTIRMNY